MGGLEVCFLSSSSSSSCLFPKKEIMTDGFGWLFVGEFLFFAATNDSRGLFWVVSYGYLAAPSSHKPLLVVVAIRIV